MTNLEPVKVATVIMSSIFGPAVAEVVGPYSVIILAASLGAAWSLGSREMSDRSSAFWFFIRINLTAILITVFLARYVGIRIGLEDSTWLLAPMALIVGGIGDNWSNIITVIIKAIKNRISKSTEGQ